MLISGIKCDSCGRTEIADFENKETLIILYNTKGWKIDDKKILCPFCKLKEIANKK